MLAYLEGTLMSAVDIKNCFSRLGFAGRREHRQYGLRDGDGEVLAGAVAAGVLGTAAVGLGELGDLAL